MIDHISTYSEEAHDLIVERDEIGLHLYSPYLSIGKREELKRRHKELQNQIKALTEV